MLNNKTGCKPKATGQYRHRWIIAVTLYASLFACVNPSQQQAVETTTTASAATPATAPTASTGTDTKAPVPTTTSSSATNSATSTSSATSQNPRTNDAQIYPGTGQFIKSQTADGGAEAAAIAGDIVLNFQDTELKEVVKVILGDMLGQNYLIDPEVKGKVTLQTSNPISTEALLPLFEKILVMNNALLIEDGSLYRVINKSKAPRGSDMPSLSRPGQKPRPGYQTYVVPLKYIPASEMNKILKPFLTDGALLHVDEMRNLLMLAGTREEIGKWLDTIEIFDVDWMRGNSVGLFKLDYVEPDTLIKELKHIMLGQTDTETASLIHFEPVTRLNSVLVITPQRRYIEQVRRWIEELDKADSGPGVRLYVYHVKNRKAADLAMVINNIFGSGESVGLGGVELAPGERATQLRSPRGSKELPAVGRSGKDETYGSKASAASRPNINIGNIDAEGLVMPDNSSIRIMADEQNNALVIMATSAEFTIVEAALEKLDTTPLQVLIEASIIEVTLTDDLQYGVEWYFKNGLANDKSGIGTLDLGAAGIAAKVPGFSYQVVDSIGGVRGVVNMLAEESNLNVLSSPSLMVLDNHTAEFRVGNQVPVNTETAITDGGVSVQSIQFKDTGVLLTITPNVNTGGLVTMDVDQEVTDVGNVDSATGQRTFLQRNIQSVVAVQSGQTIVLGGLILENESFGESGVPFIYKIPVLGKLFGKTEQSSDRTELLVLITPKVIGSDKEASDIMDEFKLRMGNIQKWPFESLRPARPGA